MNQDKDLVLLGERSNRIGFLLLEYTCTRQKFLCIPDQTSGQKLTHVLCFLQRQVIVHVTFLKVGEINTLKEQFDADVLVRSKWREPQLDSYKPMVSAQRDF